MREGPTMRKTIGFALALALLCGGTYLLYIQMFVAHVTYLRGLLMGGMLAGIGGLWLWSDYIGPMFGRGGGM
jgi:hypothetical protein